MSWLPIMCSSQELLLLLLLLLLGCALALLHVYVPYCQPCLPSCHPHRLPWVLLMRSCSLQCLVTCQQTWWLLPPGAVTLTQPCGPALLTSLWSWTRWCSSCRWGTGAAAGLGQQHYEASSSTEHGIQSCKCIMWCMLRSLPGRTGAATRTGSGRVTVCWVVLLLVGVLTVVCWCSGVCVHSSRVLQGIIFCRLVLATAVAVVSCGF